MSPPLLVMVNVATPEFEVQTPAAVNAGEFAEAVAVIVGVGVSGCLIQDPTVLKVTEERNDVL